MKKVEKWRPIILTFESDKRYENPFTDCIIVAKFKGPSNQVIIREAYWDGNNTYKVSFAPTEIGVWTYSLKAKEETGLNNISGKIECIPYNGDLEIYKHGFLKISDDNRYLHTSTSGRCRAYIYKR